MGIKHCGKSTQGRRLSASFNCPFFDTDDEILKSTNKTARQIYVEKGEDAFKDAELDACRKIEAIVKDVPSVIATGGGICNNIEAIKVLKSTNGIFVYLKISEVLAADRIVREAIFTAQGIENLPAYIAKKSPQSEKDIRAIFHDFYIQREQKYNEIADAIVDVSDESKSANTQKIIDLLAVAGFATVSTT